LAAQTDWPIYGHDPGGQQFSPLKQINTKNVTQLRVAWTYDARPAAAPTPDSSVAPSAESTIQPARPPRNRSSEASPLVVGNVLYLGTPYNHVVALEADTGRLDLGL
jgi:quinoprotein glucose dehydrogenase